MKTLGLSSSSNETIGGYLNVIRERIEKKISEDGFIGHLHFKVNIKDGRIQNINIGGEESIKI